MPYPDMPYPNGTVPLCSDWMSAPSVCLHVVQSGWVDYIRSLRTFQNFCEAAVPDDHEYESEGSFHSQLANDSEEADDSDESGEELLTSQHGQTPTSPVVHLLK